MAAKIQRFPSGFVLVDRKVKSISTIETKVDVDNELKILYEEVHRAKEDKNGEILLKVAKAIKQYFGDNFTIWVRDQVDYAKLDNMRWNFFIEIVRILNGDKRSIGSWRNGMTMAIRGDELDFKGYAAIRERSDTTTSRTYNTPRNSDLIRVTDIVKPGHTYNVTPVEFIQRLNSLEEATFILYVLYSQDAEYYAKIRDNKRTSMLPKFIGT